MVAQQFAQFGAGAVLMLGAAGDESAEHGGEATGLQTALADRIGHKVVERAHRDRSARARRGGDISLASADIVPVATALARARAHGRPAASAAGDAGQEDGALGDARRHASWMARRQLRLHGVEHVVFHNARDGDADPFLAGSRLVRAIVTAIEVVHAEIGGAGEHLVHSLQAERPAVPVRAAMCIEPGGRSLDAKRTGFAVAVQIELKRKPDDVRFARVNLQNLLVLRAVACSDDRAVAEGRPGPVPEAAPGILQHRAPDVLGGFVACIFVKRGQHGAHERAVGVRAHVLRHRNYPHAITGKLAFIESKAERLAEEPRKAMHQKQIGRDGARLDVADHPLEFRPGVVAR